ncbi:hypothetical protein SKAU_G00208050 [Synaphobranchus kaupii]|uniref:Uncharacterized protein n=1 Tax=Synaphobranchus kaupii TaxID=118154 RepID=A0A9Q1IUR6_SYNKA|nr:hypothetical protein SKAU_G00208050 [Synaphobranchus kaupii]
MRPVCPVLAQGPHCEDGPPALLSRPGLFISSEAAVINEAQGTSSPHPNPGRGAAEKTTGPAPGAGPTLAKTDL